jgi:DNA polymerase V
MQTLDGVNKRYGRGTIKLASSGTQTQHSIWQMKQQRKTPSYTTSWDELGIVRT